MWWFSDYDGTINVDHNDIIRDNDYKFIKTWLKCNKFAIATGRPYPETKYIYSKLKLNFDYIICCNGAAIYKKEVNKIKLVENRIIPFEDRKIILEIFEELKNTVSLSVCQEDVRIPYSYVYISEIYDNKFLANYAPKKNNYDEATNIIKTSDKLNICYLYVNKNDSSKYKEMLNKKLKYCKAINTHVNVIEIVEKNVSKAYGIKQIMNFENFNTSQLITSGDGENDIEMLEMTKYSFAMEHHQPNVDKYANFKIQNISEIGDILISEGIKFNEK